MYLDSAKKEEIFGKFGKGTTDTGSAESQIALFSFRISHLTEHMKSHATSTAIVLSSRLWVCVSKKRGPLPAPPLGES